MVVRLMPEPIRQFSAALAAVIAWLGLLLAAIFVNTDDAFIYLEDSEDLRNHPAYPVLVKEDAQPIAPGVKVPVDIEILPSSTLYRQGEVLELVVQGRDTHTHPKMAYGYPVNQGTHRLRAGGAHQAFLLVPVID
ncbi:MAG: hypothetical protein ACON4V_06730 [Parvibaculales bacterium]